jgi:hypothetical protein
MPAPAICMWECPGTISYVSTAEVQRHDMHFRCIKWHMILHRTRLYHLPEEAGFSKVFVSVWDGEGIGGLRNFMHFAAC